LRTRYRCIHDIVYDLLKTLAYNQYMVKTRLCSYSNLPLDRCNEILSILESNGLIISRNIGIRTIITITDKGYVYIGLYEQMTSILRFPHRKPKY